MFFFVVVVVVEILISSSLGYFLIFEKVVLPATFRSVIRGDMNLGLCLSTQHFFQLASPFTLKSVYKISLSFLLGKQ